MASHKTVYTFHLSSLLLLLLLTTTTTTATTTTFGDVDNKVTVSLYYESLCPYCANFIVNQLGGIFQSDLISIVNLRLIPWGNTQFSANNTWICQHGVDECVLNIVEACAINLLPDLGLRFRFIQCIELLHLQDKHNEWESCLGSLKINPKPINDCYQSRSGVDLELRYADETNHLNPPHRFVPWVVVNNKPLQELELRYTDETNHLNPPHRFVPWVVVNNKPLQEDYQNFVAYVCKAYRGQSIPQACKPHLLGIKSTEMSDFDHQVSYPGNSKDTALFVPEAKRQDQQRKNHLPTI